MLVSFMRTSRLLFRLRASWLRQLTLWAMVPLTFCSGWPVLGCICADGNYTSDCPALRRPASELTNELCCRKACCATAEADRVIKSCCQDAADSQQSHPDDETRCRLNHRDCCHIVVQSGELPTLLQLVQVADEHGAFISSDMPAWDGALLLALQRASFVENETGQAPCDLVIALRRLII
jgi:hypothetical protein